MGTITLRVRSLAWFSAGALIATAVLLMFANAWRADAAPGDSDSTFVGITPCRLADTRPAPNRVGPAAALGPGGTQSFAVHGSNGECTIPAEAVAVSLNVTALGASTLTFLTFWPDGEQPLAASLNPAPGQPPVPNAVTVDLSDAGAFNVFNNAGTVNAVIDVNGYYTQASLKELAERLAAVEAAQAAGVDPAVLARIDALEVSQPFAVSETEGDALQLTTAVEPYVTVDVTAPVDGQVTVAGHAKVFHIGDDGRDVGCVIKPTALIPVAIGLTTPGVLWFEKDGAADDGGVAGTDVFDIAAGETITYALACAEFFDGGRVDSAIISAIFTPAP